MSALETPLGITHIHEYGELTVVGPLAHQMDLEEQQGTVRHEVSAVHAKKAGSFALGTLHWEMHLPWGDSHNSNL